MSYQRGDIYYIKKFVKGVGSEQNAGRPGIIVSNDKLNKTSPVVEVVYLTTKKKPNIPTHVEITSSGAHSTALCEQITTVSVKRIEKWCGRCSESEMAEINKALCYSVQLPIRETPDFMKRGIETAKWNTLKEIYFALLRN